MNLEYIGRELQTLRKAARASLEGLAAVTRIEETRLTRIESAGATPTPTELITLAWSLHAPPDTLSRWLSDTLFPPLPDEGRQFAREALLLIGLDAAGALPLSPPAVRAAMAHVRHGLRRLDDLLAGHDVEEKPAGKRPAGSVRATWLGDHFEGGRAAAAAWASQLPWPLRFEDTAGLFVSALAFMPNRVQVGSLSKRSGRPPRPCDDVLAHGALLRILNEGASPAAVWRSASENATRRGCPFMPHRTFRRWLTDVRRELSASGRLNIRRGE